MSDGPSQIGRYVVEGELGRGAMGIVYRARDPRIDRVVALKTLLPLPGLDKKMSAQLKERFLNEGRAAGRLAHPAIVTVHDADEDPSTGVAYLVMELVEGTDLRTLLPGLSVDKLLVILEQVAVALDHAHERGVVHRDVKPANVLVDARGRARLTDFGIARLGDSTMTQTGQFLGSPAYMSPEQVRGQPVTPATDIFSLGVILYEGLTGKKPFEGDSLVSTAHAIANDEPVRPSDLQPNLGSELDEVMRKALAKLPADRYTTAESLIAAASRAVRGLTPERTATLTGTVPGLGARPARPWALPAAGASLLAALVIAGLALVSGTGDSDEDPMAVAAAAQGGAAEGSVDVEPADVAPTTTSTTASTTTTTTTTTARRRERPPAPTPQRAAPAATPPRATTPSRAAAPTTGGARLSVELHTGHAGTLVVHAGGREIGRVDAYRETKGKGKGRFKVMRDPVVQRSAAWAVPTGEVRLTFSFYQREGRPITQQSQVTTRSGATRRAKVYVGPLGKDLDVRWD